MIDCLYCLETGNHYISTELDKSHRVETEVMTCQKPCLMVRSFQDGFNANWKIGIQIKYCPMYGRKLGNE